MRRQIQTISLILLLLNLKNNSYSQCNLENGFYFPVHTGATPIHVLIVTVELDGGACAGISPGCAPSNQLPANIDDYFDHVLPSTGPEKYFTKFLYQSSFGQCVVLGDYLDQVVHVPCLSASPFFGPLKSRIS